MAISDSGVTSINYIAEHAVYSKDAKILFHIPKAAMTRALIKGYLQLAVYDRTTKAVAMLDKVTVSGVREDLAPASIVIEATLEAFRVEAQKAGWNEYLLPRNATQVNPVNLYPHVAVYTSDGLYLFDVARDQNEYIRASGFLHLAAMPDGKTVQIVAKLPLKK